MNLPLVDETPITLSLERNNDKKRDRKDNYERRERYSLKRRSTSPSKTISKNSNNRYVRYCPSTRSHQEKRRLGDREKGRRGGTSSNKDGGGGGDEGAFVVCSEWEDGEGCEDEVRKLREESDSRYMTFLWFCV